MKKLVWLFLFITYFNQSILAQTPSDLCLQSSRYILFLKASHILIDKHAYALLESLAQGQITEEEHRQIKLGLNAIPHNLCQPELLDGIKEFVKLNQDRCANHRSEEEIESYTKELVNDIDGIKIKSSKDAIKELEKKLAQHLIDGHRIRHACLDRIKYSQEISGLELHHPSTLLCKQIVDFINNVKKRNQLCLQ